MSQSGIVWLNALIEHTDLRRDTVRCFLSIIIQDNRDIFRASLYLSHRLLLQFVQVYLIVYIYFF